MRVWLALALLTSIARADTSVAPASGPFDRFVRELAARRGQRVIASWQVNLDLEPDLESVAVLYDTDGAHGDFIIAKRGRRWDVRFDADGRTLPRANGELVPPPSDELYRGPHARHPQTILYRVGHRGGYWDRLLALREGHVAVVYEEELDDALASDPPEATDWDALVRGKQARYQLVEPGDEDDYGGLVLRTID